jgi:hypothetical protein
MPVSKTDIDALNTALAAGERMVRSGDKSVEYRSVAELIRARDDLVNQLAAETAATAGTARSRQTRLYHAGRGY